MSDPRDAWEREVMRLHPDIMRNPVAHSLVVLAEQVFGQPGEQEDPHRRTARLMFGKAASAVTENERGTGKTMNIAVATRLSAAELSARLGISLEESNRLYWLFCTNVLGVTPPPGKETP